MKLKVLFFSLFVFFNLILLSKPIQAANIFDIVINEIAWMGTQVSYNDEWIELYNQTDSPINLEDWTLKADDDSPNINLTGTIPANGFFLLERTDDNTVSDISASQIYKGALENSGENLKLYNTSMNPMDSVDCSSGWFAGDNNTKQTMERTDSGNWQNSKNPNGTPGIKNSVIIEPSPPEELIEVEPQSSFKEEQKPVAYPSGVIINEILPSPEGLDSEEEWIEIFNQNNFEVNLFGWQITDLEGKTNTYTFPKEMKILAKGFLILFRPVSKITLNNSGDGLNLIQPDGKITDSLNYEKAPRGESFSQTESGWIWSSTLTPGSTNIIPTKVEETEEEINGSVFEEKTQKEARSGKELAAISEQVSKENSKSLFILLTALVVAIFSGIIILFLKKRLKMNYNKNI